MWLMLCSSTDAPALWAYKGLKRLGVEPIELVLSEGLAHASRWEHRVDEAGARLSVTLPDGRVIDASRIRGAVNRLLGPCPAFAGWEAAPDSAYMQAELHAFYLSWLQSLPGILINRPAATGLCGPWLHASEWIIRAARAGLETRRYRQEARPGQSGAPPVAGTAASRQVIAFDGDIFGAAAPEVLTNACRKLADNAATAMLGIVFDVDPSGQWHFSDATPCPDLSMGGMPLLRRMAVRMQEACP